MTKQIKSCISDGKATLAAYVAIRGLDSVEAQQDYTIADAIAGLLHLAKHRGFDLESIVRRAVGYVAVEITVCSRCGGVGAPAVFSAYGGERFCDNCNDPILPSEKRWESGVSVYCDSCYSSFPEAK